MVFLQSVRGVCDTYVLLSERDPGPERRADLERRTGCRVLFMTDLGLAQPWVMAFQYDVFEMSTALKPNGFVALFAAGYRQVLYFDTDIECYGPLDPIFEELTRVDAVVPPHIDAPLPNDGHSPTNEDILRSGQLNSGFLALNKTPETEQFARWWADRLNENCIFHINHYFFVDQFHLAMIVSFVKKLSIYHHPGANAAYWNLPQRAPFVAVGECGTLRGEPLIFFHYSGFAAEDLPRISRHQNRYRLPNDHPILPLFARYRDRLAAAEVALSDLDLSYSFTRYADGSPIPMADRRRVLLADPAVKAGLTDPFQGLGDLASTNPLPPWPVPRAEVEAERAQAAAAFVCLGGPNSRICGGTRCLASSAHRDLGGLSVDSQFYRLALNRPAAGAADPVEALSLWGERAEAHFFGQIAQNHIPRRGTLGRDQRRQRAE
ncbi:hypothetical protein VZ95_02085 [Elstera litoralis]|uniref:Nucleotide-diphospho-sugar transferase domain-containing protein n=1 Tax=Elstera litoralis TaxID=552518 RepID=A0A0F3IWD3_9PROT|nr:hypothetical protein VZ95_02085 [Elstera litoralis]